MPASNARKGKIGWDSAIRRGLIVGSNRRRGRHREAASDELAAHRRPQATNLSNRPLDAPTTKRHSLIQRANGRSPYAHDAAAESGRSFWRAAAAAAAAKATTFTISAAFPAAAATNECSHVSDEHESILVSIRCCFVATLAIADCRSSRPPVAHNRS